MLKKIAEEAGFDLVTVTNADPMLAAKRFLEEWVAAGFNADMDWLAKDIEKRISPKKILAGAESVIMLAKNYFSEDLEEFAEGGYIAKYARYRDYHREIGQRIKKMIKLLEQHFPEEEFKFYVDYGPLLEKGFALKTGMGIVGKNTTLISKEFGSWILLAEIISTVKPEKFKHENPERSYENCGSCSNCIDKCPTGALTKPYVMNAGKCISYLTIENKNGIPLELRKKIGNHIFGCDICQLVCPFNKRIAVKTVKADWQKKNPSHLDPNIILSMRNEEEFKERFAGSPIMRAKFRGMLRNSAVVAGNLKLKNCRENLRFWSNCGDSMLEEHSVWALSEIEKGD